MEKEVVNDYQLHTDTWVKEVVIGLQLCPFAEGSIKNDRLVNKVFLETQVEKLLEGLIMQLNEMRANPKIESALITMPNAPSDFIEFWQLTQMAEDLIEDSGFSEEFQLANFHPEYIFDQTEEDDPSNFTNRSPYPTWHPIRVDSMTKAIDSHPDVEGVPAENIRKTRELGIDYMKQLFLNCFHL